jgi:predicted nucleic acid-binding protein
MRTAVIDSSALLRLFVPDGPLPEGLEDLVDAAWRGDAVLLAPELVLAEVAAVLRRKERDGHLSQGEVDEVLAAFLDLPLDLVGHRTLVEDAVTLSRQHGLTAYDALFFALSRQRRVDLISADEELSTAWTKDQCHIPTERPQAR